MIRTYFGGMLAAVGAFACTVGSSSGQVVFSDDFTAADGTVVTGRVPTVGQAWNQTAGPNMTIQGGAIDTTGAGRTLFGLLATPFDGTKRLLKLTVDISSVSHNAGYAGVSLFDGTAENIFLGDPSDTNPSIGFEVALSTRSYANPVTPNGLVTLLYDSQTGRTALFLGDTISGTPLAVQIATPGYHFDRIRIQNGNGGDIKVSSVKAEMLDQGPISIDKFEADIPIVKQGSDFPPDLAWTTSFADQVSIAPGIGSVSPAGDQLISNLTVGDHVYTLTAKDSVTGNSLTANTTLRAVVGGASTYRYVRYQTIKTRDASASPWTQLSEFQFYNGTTQVQPVAVTNPGGNVAQEAEDQNKVIDNNVATKWLDYNKAPLVFDFGTPQAFDNYIMTTANDAPERDPVRWILEGSNDGTTWTLIDNVTAFDYTTPKQRSTATYAIPLPGSSLTPYVGLKVTGDVTTVASGDPVILTYSSLYAQTLTINNGTTTTPVTPLNGTLTLTPTATTTYTLTATGTGGVTKTATYQVNVVTPAITQIAYADFDNSGNELSLLGTATVLSDPSRPLPSAHKRLRITDAVNDQNNSVWFRKRQNVGQGFTTDFGLHITRLDNGGGADGAAFIVQNAPGGSDLLVAGAETGTQTNALTIGFDTYVNAGDPSAAVLRIASGGTVISQTDLTTVPGLTLRSAGHLLDPTGGLAPYAVHVVYAPGSLSVSIDGVVIVQNLNVNLATLNAVDANGTAYVGFAARTGGLSEAHDITSWTLTTGAVTPTTDLKIVSSSFNLTTNEITLTWTSSASKTYRVTSSADLATWPTVLRSAIPGAANQTTATIPFTRATKGFFRVEQE